MQDLNVITEPLHLDVYGLSAAAPNKDYVATIFRLSGRMWEIVKTNALKNKGKNVWLYDDNHQVFAGVELEEPVTNTFGLEKRTIVMEKYARYTHRGSYNLIRQSGERMTSALNQRGHRVVLPYVEIYGHWSNDESKLETELIMCLQ